jgi:glycosyltransferase involved in cell wall biosynthesis
VPHSERRRILFVGHGGLPNGFSRVIATLLSAFPTTCELHQLVVNDEFPCPRDGWAVHGNAYLPDLHSARALQEIVDRIDPDLLVVVDEPWVCARRLDSVRDRYPQLRTVMYCAVDGEASVTPKVAASLASASMVVVFTDFARNIVREHVTGLPDGRLRIIPHGVDLNTFFPLGGDDAAAFRESRQQARRILFPQSPELQDAFIVLNANRNQPWKGIEACIEGFALFARDKPAGVKLYLHMGTRAATPGTLPLIDRFGIRDRLLYTALSNRHPDLPSETLNLLYNACDTGINSSDKEGWGLISFEHAATGAPQIVPCNSAPAELWRGSALMLECEKESCIRGYRRAGHAVKPESIAKQLQILYANPAERSGWAEAAYRNATQPKYDWRNIARQWTHVFEDVLAMPQGDLASVKCNGN